MKSLFLVGLLFFAVLATVAFPQAGNTYDESLYTPSEIQRNAQRKAFGMPPLPPKALRKKVPKQKSEGNTNNNGIGLVSFSTPQASTGYIAVHHDDIDGPLLGYLSNHKIVPHKSVAVLYTYTTNGYVTEILVANSNLRMCVSTGLYGQSLGLGLRNFHVPRHSLISTAQGDGPFHDHATAQHLETKVFSIDAITGEIEVEWVNPDGGRPSVHIALREERLYYVGDLDTFREHLGYDGIVPVVYKWVANHDNGIRA